MMTVFAIAIGLMVSSVLACAVEGALGTSYLRVGPVEVRLLFIAISDWLAAGGRTSLEVILPGVAVVLGMLLAGMVVQTQARLRRADRAHVIHHNHHAGARQTGAVLRDPRLTPGVAPDASPVR